MGPEDPSCSTFGRSVLTRSVIRRGRCLPSLSTSAYDHRVIMRDRQGPWSRMKRDRTQLAENEIGFWWRAIGTLVGCLSIISFTQKNLNLGLTPIPFQILKYYRSATQPVRDLISWLSPWSMPEWYSDMLILSALFSSTMLRAVLKSQHISYWRRAAHERPATLRKTFPVVILAIMSAVSLLGLLAPLVYLVVYLRANEEGVQVKYSSALEKFDRSYDVRLPYSESISTNRTLLTNLGRAYRSYLLWQSSRYFLVSLAMAVVASVLFFVWGYQPE